MRVRSTQIRLIRSSGKGRSDICAGRLRARDEKTLRDFYRRAFTKAVRAKKRALTCAVDCAAGAGISLIAHAKILGQEVFRIIHEEKCPLRELTIAVESCAWAEFRRYCLGYIDYIANKLRSPFLTVDAIIEVGKGIVVIRRTNPPFGWALPGGFVDYGESLEEAAVREAKEETGLAITGLRQFHTYSQPDRDPRFHTVGTVFIARAQGKPRAGDDAAQARIMGFNEVERLDFAFDHKKILKDYLRQRRKAQSGCRQ